MKKSKSKSEFRFKDIVIQYTLKDRADVYYLTNNHDYNREVNEMLIDFWYTRTSLIPSNFLVEQSLGFDYKRHWVYAKNEEERLNNEGKERAKLRREIFKS